MLVPDPGSGTERAKILDFGIAKMDVRGLDMEDPQTRAGILMGTPYYMSPEQCRGASKVDDKADVYSLGVMMFQMLAGRLPFLPGEEGEGDAAVLAKHVYEPAPSVRSLGPKISEPLDRLVLEMLSKERAQRPTMAVVAARLGMLGGNKGLTGELSMTFEEEFPTRQMPEISTMLPQPQVGQSAAASQPSTLGGGTGQIRRLTLSEAVIKIGKWKTPITVALGMVAGVLLYSGFDAWRRPKPGVDEAVSGAPLPLPQKADTIRTCELWTEPSGVEVRRAESAEKLGVTPWTHRHPASAAPIVLMLKKDGYADRALVLDCERGPVRTEKLEKLAAVTPTVPRVVTSPDAPKPGLASAPKKAPTKATSKTVAKRKKPAKRVLKRRR